jgi:hypothetical protein
VCLRERFQLCAACTTLDRRGHLQGRTPKVTCLYDPRSEPTDLLLQPSMPPPRQTRSLGPFCLGAIAAVASARYMTWRQARSSQGEVPLRMLRTLIWLANLMWCLSSSVTRVLHARAKKDRGPGDATQSQAAWTVPQRVVPSLEFDLVLRFASLVTSR